MNIVLQIIMRITSKYMELKKLRGYVELIVAEFNLIVL